MTVTPQQIEAAKVAGLTNVETAAAASEATGLPFYILCAILEKESGGRNVYGHDQGGALSGFPGEVTQGNFEVFRWLIDNGHTSNGVGPMQLTWKPFFDQMDEKALLPWNVYDNMVFGADVFKGYYDTYRQTLTEREAIRQAGRKYNGSDSYGDSLVEISDEWRERLEPASELDVRARLYAWGFRKADLTEAIKDWQMWLWNYSSRSQADGVLGPQEKRWLAADDTRYGTAPVLGDEIGRQYGFKDRAYVLGYHTGDDIRGELGDPARCVRSGTVIAAGYGVKGTPYGNTVVVRTPDGIDCLYAHLSRISVTVGQKVGFTQTVGIVGNTSGTASIGPHLHYEECAQPWTYGKQRKPVWDRSPADPYPPAN